MNIMQEILENTTINRWAQHFSRNPQQYNKLHETDAELLEIPGLSNYYLAVTIDTVAEEITTGIYRDPYTMGWVTIMACVSDLAAVGAQPLGLVISVSYESHRDQKFVDEVARGMQAACQKTGIFILGGDLNTTESISLTACSFGLVPKDKTISRRGCKPGDNVYITGRAGSGNALGLVRLTDLPSEQFSEQDYLPVVNIKAGQMIRQYASCCMDTSDGVLTTLDQLMRLNEVGFQIDCQWERMLDHRVLNLCKKTSTPPWMMLAGLHGEFILLCTMSSSQFEKMGADSDGGVIELIKIGKVQQLQGITMNSVQGEKVTLDMALIRNLLQNVQGDLNKYIEEFWNVGEQWGLNQL